MTFSKIVKSAPKKNQFWSSKVWVLSTFLSSLLAACFHIILPSKLTERSLRQPDILLEGCASGARPLIGAHPPAKNLHAGLHTRPLQVLWVIALVDNPESGMKVDRSHPKFRTKKKQMRLPKPFKNHNTHLHELNFIFWHFLWELRRTVYYGLISYVHYGEWNIIHHCLSQAYHNHK